MKYWLPRSLQQKNKKNNEKNNNKPSAKWQKKAKSKDKKLIHYTNDELEYESMPKLSSENDKSNFDKTDKKETRVYFNFT